MEKKFILESEKCIETTASLIAESPEAVGNNIDLVNQWLKENTENAISASVTTVAGRAILSINGKSSIYEIRIEKLNDTSIKIVVVKHFSKGLIRQLK